MAKSQYRYCNTCKKGIENPIKKPIDSMEKSIWIIIILSTLGLGIIPFLIYQYGMKERNYCPECQSKLQISDKPFEEPKKAEKAKPKTPKEKVLAKVEEKEEAETKPSRKKPTKIEEGVEEETVQKAVKKPVKKKPVKIKEEEEKVKKVEKAKKKRVCPFCGEVLKKDYAACPYCNTKLHD
jgi:preprotein translocase subunit SecF